METKPLFYPVRKVPVKGLIPLEYLPNNNIDQAIVVDYPEGPRIVNFCSKSYELQTNESIVGPLFEAFAIKGLKIKMEFKIRDHAKFYIDFIATDFANSITEKDDVFPRLRVQNSYDGSLKYQGSFGLYRLVCLNGLSIPVQNATTSTDKMMHTAQVLSDLLVTETLDKFEVFCEKASEFLEPFQKLRAQPIYAPEQRIMEVATETNFPKKMAEDALERLNIEMAHFGLATANDWLIYNALNYQLNHGETRAKEHKKDKVDLEILDFLLYS